MGVPIACRRVHSAAAREGGCGMHPSARDWDTYKPQGGSFEKCSQPKRCYTLLRQCVAQHKLTRAPSCGVPGAVAGRICTASAASVTAACRSSILRGVILALGPCKSSCGTCTRRQRCAPACTRTCTPIMLVRMMVSGARKLTRRSGTGQCRELLSQNC